MKDAAPPGLCFRCDLCRLGQDRRRGGYCNGLGRGAGGRGHEEDRSKRRRISALGGLLWGMEECVAAEVPRFSLGQQERGSHLLAGEAALGFGREGQGGDKSRRVGGLGSRREPRREPRYLPAERPGDGWTRALAPQRTLSSWKVPGELGLCPAQGLCGPPGCSANRYRMNERRNE